MSEGIRRKRTTRKQIDHNNNERVGQANQHSLSTAELVQFSGVVEECFEDLQVLYSTDQNRARLN